MLLRITLENQQLEEKKILEWQTPSKQLKGNKV